MWYFRSLLPMDLPQIGFGAANTSPTPGSLTGAMPPVGRHGRDVLWWHETESVGELRSSLWRIPTAAVRPCAPAADHSGPGGYCVERFWPWRGIQPFPIETVSETAVRTQVAVAAMGNPKVVYLDEPTTGMDPLHRRQVHCNSSNGNNITTNLNTNTNTTNTTNNNNNITTNLNTNTNNTNTNNTNTTAAPPPFSLRVSPASHGCVHRSGR